MQVKVFDIGAPEQEINDFLTSHQVIENGILVRPQHIVVLYLPTLTEEESKIKRLENTLAAFNDQYTEAVINHAFYLRLEMAGKGNMELKRDVQTPVGPSQMTTTVSAELARAKVGLESIKLQMVVLKEMIGNPPMLEEEPSTFGKRNYAKKDKPLQPDTETEE